MSNFSDKLRAFRKKCGLTQAGAAKKLGVSGNYVYQLEAGLKQPGDGLEKLLDMLIASPLQPSLSHTPSPLETLTSDVVGFYGSPRQKLKAAREKAGLTIAQLAKAIGYSIGPLQALEDGSARISEKQAAAIVNVLPGLTVDDLLDGGEALRVFSEDGAHGIIGQRPNLTLQGVKARYVPLLSFAQAGRTDLAALDEGWTGEAFIAFDVADPKAFALRIEGDSMVPAINPGDVVIASPASSIRRGDEVIVRTIDGECFCKIWDGVSNGVVTLSSHNPLHKSFTLHQSQIAWVYPVIQTSKTRR